MSALTRWRALGTTVELLAEDRSRLLVARVAVERELVAIDRACSRFRADSELRRLNAAAGTGPQCVGPLLLEAVVVALDAAARTGGAVDPTVGHAMTAIGYDRDLALVPAVGPAVHPRPAPGTAGIFVARGRTAARDQGTIDLPAGVALDLGATAKAFAADRAAAAALRAVHAGGVLVSLGGDVAVAGPAPRGGWAVGIADDHRDRRPQHVVAVDHGGLATSGLGVRRWRRGGRDVHHVVDPRTGEPVAPVWRTVSVAAPSCVAANTWSTAALVLGEAAPRALRAAGVAARLVADDGSVTTVGGWPADESRAEAA
ncbi:FAD:protein FMN transferase [Patulibacter sp. NPDC049589]|uniref:FAD:protein FMN transferase n=1 Tax=Patulibacter sp. NPDC049589 TaxID=3154731 RepID=UPI003445919C